MKKSLKTILAIIMILVTTGGFSLPVVAQSENATNTAKINPVEVIESESAGNIKINIPENILELIISDQDSQKKATGPVIKPGVNKLTGYRIQVFSDGRGHHSLESRAKARGSAIASRFPKYRGQVYTYSAAPNWYTRIGNFVKLEEATDALNELKRAFPQFASEMRVVKSQIVIIK